MFIENSVDLPALARGLANAFGVDTGLDERPMRVEIHGPAPPLAEAAT